MSLVVSFERNWATGCAITATAASRLSGNGLPPVNALVPVSQICTRDACMLPPAALFAYVLPFLGWNHEGHQNASSNIVFTKSCQLGKKKCAWKSLGRLNHTDVMPWGFLTSHNHGLLQQPGPFTYAHLDMMTLRALLLSAAQYVYS